MNSDGPYTADEKFVIKAFGSLDKITQQMFLAWATLVRIEGDAKRAQNWISEAMGLNFGDKSTHNIPPEKPAESETLSEAEIALLAGTATDEWKTQKWTTYESVDAVDVTESKEKGLGYIYAVEFGDYIKIGYTVSPKSRLATHAATARNYGTFKTGRVLLSPPHKDYIKTEKTLHDYFTSYRKGGTELFELDFQDMEAQSRGYYGGSGGISMNELQIFTNDTFGEVRTVVKDNEPWFVAADVCRAFGVTTPSHVTSRLDEDEKGMHDVNTLGGKQTVTIINEAGLYHALFTMEPKNARGISDEAINERIEKLRSFKRWITHEVIPTIRKTGAYMTPETAMKIVSNPDFLIATANKIKQLQGDVAERDERITELEDQLTAAVEDNDKLSKRIMENGIKAWFADRVIDSGENMCIRETAKELGVKESDFTSMLVERKYLYRNKGHQGRLLPYSSPQCRGVFVVKEVQFKGGMTYQSQTLVTPAGRIKLHAECIKAGLINEMPVQDSILWEV